VNFHHGSVFYGSKSSSCYVRAVRGGQSGSFDNLVFNLGLIELLSYWKATCSREIEVQTHNLDKDQINWWKDLIFEGMGQFFYENKIMGKKI